MALTQPQAAPAELSDPGATVSATGEGRSAKLLRELNEVQHRSLSARIELVDDLVLVSQTVSPYGLTGPVLAQAMEAVGSTAAHIGPLLVALFGGSTPFQDTAVEASGWAQEDNGQ
jgi:hypothetical protein